MRLTVVLCRHNRTFIYKNLWKDRSQIRGGVLIKPRYLDTAGIPIVTATNVLKKLEPEFPQWSPSVPDDIQFAPPPTIKDDPDYHEQHIYEFSTESRLTEGETQAIILTKSQPFLGLPPSISKLVGKVSIPDQDIMMQRIIMQSHKYDPTKEKLPKRNVPELPIWKHKAEFGIPDYKIATLTLQNTLQLCDTLIGKYPILLDQRRLVKNVQLSTYFHHLEETHVAIKGNTDAVIFSSQPLEPFAGDEIIDQSIHYVIPDIFPLFPTIDLKQQHVWKYENIIGYMDGYTFSHPHTIFLCYDDQWTTSQYNAKSLMFSFGYAVGLAKKLYGDDVGLLPKPISIKCVTTNGIGFNFTCFQLNTLDFSSPVKNLVWFDSENALFNKIIPKRAMLRHTKYEDYDPEVTKKILAFYINGTNLEKLSE